MPKLSIITINLNNKQGLEKTIQSVIEQTYTNFEYIVIDGDSIDGSVDLIEKYSNRLTYWISEPDKGVYNAMNKGILHAKGEYCLFLNSGDWLTKSTIIEEVFIHINSEDIIYGNGFTNTTNGTSRKYEIPVKLSLDYFSHDSLFHPSTLIKRCLFDKYGLYNESNIIVSDWEFFIKTIIINHVKAKKIPIEISIIEDNGMSRNIENKTILQEEVNSVFQKYFPSKVKKLADKYREQQFENNQIRYGINMNKKGFVFIKRIFRKIKSLFSKNKKTSLKNIFSNIYENNAWGGEHSVSGPGSDIVQTKTIIQAIPELIIKFNVKKITDAPCGDFLWMNNIISSVYNFIDNYIGIDIVDKLIEDNLDKYKKDKINFISTDITKSKISYSDLIVCRDCFIHLSYSNIFKILKNFKKSNSTFLLVSTYTKHNNFDVPGYFPLGRALNMEIFPFNLSTKIEIINENCTEQKGIYSDKSLMLLKFKDINLFKIRFNIILNNIKSLVNIK